MSIANLDKAKALQVDASDEWLLGRRPVDYVMEEWGDGVDPDMLVCYSMKTGQVIGVSMCIPDIQPDDLADWAIGCMLNPRVGEPHRPGQVELVGSGLQPIQPVLEELGVQISVRIGPSHYMDEVMDQMESALNGEGIPPTVSGPDRDPEIIGEFFEAATEFWKFRPTRLFRTDTPARVDLPFCEGPTSYWAFVLGMGSDELVLNMYKSADDVLAIYESTIPEEADHIRKNTWMLRVTFDDFDDLGPEEEEEWYQYKWELPDPSVYPSAIVLDPEVPGRHRRPTEQEFLHVIATLRALTRFMRHHRKRIMDYQIVEDTVTVEASWESLDVFVVLPAPECLVRIDPPEDEPAV